MAENKMPGLLEAKRALNNPLSPFTVEASGFGHHPMSSFRITEIVREEGTYYGKSAEDNRWYPISSIEIKRVSA